MLKRKPKNKKLNQENRIFLTKWDKEEKKDVDKSEIIITKKFKIKEQLQFFINDRAEISLPEKNQLIRVVVKRIPSQTFIYKIAEQEIIEEMTISIFSISKSIILGLSNLVEDGKILKLNILVSDMWAKLKKETDYLFLRQNLPDSKLGMKRIHTKIMLAKTNKGNYYVYEGSGNLSTNTNFEQYIFEENEAAYNFHYNWINNFIDEKN